MSGVGTVARAIVRSWRRHPLSLVVAVIALGLATTLVGTIIAVERSVSAAVSVATSVGPTGGDLVVVPMNGSGFDESVGAQITQAAPDAVVTGVLRGQTRLGVGEEPGVVVGVGIPNALASASVELAEREDLGVGDALRVATPSGWQSVTVDAVGGDEREDGSVQLPLEEAQELFERPGTVDAFVITTAEPAAVEQVLSAQLGDLAKVSTPAELEALELGVFATIQAVLAIVSGIGLFGAMLVLVLVWRRLLQQEHERFAMLRLLGADRGTLLAAGLAVLGVVTIAGAALGALGCRLAALAIEPMTDELIGLTGVVALDDAAFDPVPTLLAIAITVVAGVAVWALTIRRVLSAAPVDAVRRPPDEGDARSGRGLVVAASISLVVAGVGFVGARLAGVGLAASLAAGALVPAVVAPMVGAALRRLRGVAPLAAGSEVAYHRSRAAALAALVGLAVLVPTVMLTMADNYRAEVDASVRAWARGGGFVTAAPAGVALRDQRLGQEPLATIRGTDGVASVGSVVLTTINRSSGKVLNAWAWDAGNTPDVRLRVSDGPSDPDDLWRRLDAGEVAVSQQIATADNLEVGDEFLWPGSVQVHRPVVAAIFDDAVNDAGLVVTSTRTLERITGENRTYNALISLDGSRPLDDVLDDVRSSLVGDFPDLVATDSDGIVNQIVGVVEQVLTVLRALAWVVVGLVALVVAMSVSGSRRDRNTTIAAWRLAGIKDRDMTWAAVLEVLVPTVVAALLGALLARLATDHGFGLFGEATGLMLTTSVNPLQATVVVLGSTVAVVVGAMVSTRAVRKGSILASRRSAAE